MADFSIAHARTTKFEGGYTDHPNDNGNWTGGKKEVGTLIGTKYGISAPVLCVYLGRIATVDDMKNLTHATAEAIYKKKYWDPLWGDQINSQVIANEMYDEGVNAGISTAIKTMQITLDLPITGRMNIETLTKINNP